MGKKVPLKHPPEANTEQVQQPHALTHQQQLPAAPPQQQQQPYYVGQIQQAQQQQQEQQQQQQQQQQQPAQWQLPQSTPQVQQPQQISFQQNVCNFQQEPFQQHYSQQQGGYSNQDGLSYQPCQPYVDPSQNVMLNPGQQQQQQQHMQQEQPLQQAQQQQQQQQQLQLQAVTQEPPQHMPYSQSVCSTSSLLQLPEYHSTSRCLGRGGGGSISLSPAKTDLALGLWDETGVVSSNLCAIPNLEPPSAKRQRLDPPVATYPERSRLDGDYQFRVEIPGTGPKLLVNRDADDKGRRINTEMSHMITLELTHEAVPSLARFRFLLVYSKDADATIPVVPCKNHSREEHPKHMLEVTVGEREAHIEWQNDPHPSVLLTPTPLAPGRFTCQLAFLCRNSCVTRKDLTLLCQLEVGDTVVGREPFKVKVSACPRRDAGAFSRRCTSGTAQRNSCGLPAPSSSPLCTYPQPQMPASDTERVMAASDIVRETMREAEQQGKRTALLVFMERYFREKFPDQYRDASEMFSQLTNGRFG